MTNLKPKTYHLILFLALFLLIPAISHATCSSVPLTGDYTVSASCTFPVNSNIGGADNGNITINSGQTLTVNAGETVAWGPGKSLIINGSIAIANGAQLKQGRICRIDADGDGYATADAPTVALTCAGKITQANMNVSMTYWADVQYDYDDTATSTYPGTVCGGDCSVNNTAGACVAASAGENSVAACQRCNGSDLTHVNIGTLNDDEGSNTCAGTCAAYCSSGSCISTDTSDGTCTVSTNARLASGGDGACTSGTCVAACSANGAACSVSGDCCSSYCYDDTDADGYAGTDAKICHASAIAYAGTDCNDGNAGIHPAVAEVCDATDWDCDGYIYKDDGVVLTTTNGCTQTGSCSGASKSCGSGGTWGSCSPYPGQYDYGTSIINGSWDRDCSGGISKQGCSQPTSCVFSKEFEGGWSCFCGATAYEERGCGENLYACCMLYGDDCPGGSCGLFSCDGGYCQCK